ncbi:hypothetical protein BH09MYX1_BH09MYX1_59660 [soil metagenome]
MQTTTSNHVAARDDMLRALVAAPNDPHRNETISEAPQLNGVAFLSGAAIAAAALVLLAKLTTREPKLALAIGAGTLAVAGLARWQMGRLFTPRTPYVMERRVGTLEIRRFERRVCAETMIDAASLEEAMEKAFRRLAKYIFSNGIAMTVPVVVTRSDRPDSELLHDWEVEPNGGLGRYTMRFFAPAGRTMDDLPSPTDDRIHLRELAGHRVVAMPFKGRSTGENIVAAQRKLLASARHALLTVRGEAMFAGHDAPSTLPFLRRSEVWVNLA